MWKYIDPWIDRRQFAFVTVSIATGLMFIFSSIVTQKVSSTSELVIIEGTLSNYSFIKVKRGGIKYYIWLDQHEATFQIPADFLDYFDKDNFEQVISKGQKLFLEISKFELRDFLESNDRIRVYGLHSESRSFLNSKESIEQENNFLGYIIGPLFILAGACFYYYRIRRSRNG